MARPTRKARRRPSAATADDRRGPPAREVDAVGMALERGWMGGDHLRDPRPDSAPLFMKPACRPAGTDGAEMTPMPAASRCAVLLYGRDRERIP